MENCEESAVKVEKNESRQKSVFTTASKKSFNPNAEPFKPSKAYAILKTNVSDDLINVGPSQVPVNAKIWRTIASTRQLPEIPVLRRNNQFPLPPTSNEITSFSSNGFFEPQGCAAFPPAFELDRKRDVVVFKREFGPVATSEGIELRLKFGVRVFISVEGGVLVENGDIRIAVSSNKSSSAIEHPNGRIVQRNDRADIVAFDGLRNNHFIRYAKIYKDCISLTSNGCALIYLVDTAGTRTTSDQVNRDWSRDYCKEVYLEGMNFRNHFETSYAAEHYRYKVDEDGMDVFIICNVRISQTRDGMVRIQSEPFSIRTSVENRNITLKTPSIHCTASMGTSPHLFVRMNERRVHFDGTNFVARNMGHSSSFDGANNLRIH